MKHLVEDMAIDKRGQYFYVMDKKTGKTYGVKYEDEEHALRYIKYLCNFKRDWRFMEVEKRVDGRVIEPQTEEKEEIVVSRTIDEPTLENELEIKEEAPRVLKNNEYMCSKCHSVHREDSGIGKKHMKYKEV